MTAGRNRSFDKDNALEQAMLVFWTNGYPGASLSDLTNAMGINKSSLYSTFSNKEELFIQAVDLYSNKHGLVHTDELFKTEKKLPERVRNYLLSIAQMMTRFDLPTGCLICNSTSEIAGDCLPDSAKKSISAMNKQTVISLTTFFEKEQHEGNLDEKCSAKTLANYLTTLQFGLAISARNGSDVEELIEVIDFAIGKF
jgi:AcrR family transcriptional regulator